MQIVAAKIKQARRDSGLTQVELAERAGVSEKMVQRYEYGQAEPRMKTLKAIAMATGKDVNFFKVERETVDEVKARLDRAERQALKFREQAVLAREELVDLENMILAVASSGELDSSNVKNHLSEALKQWRAMRRERDERTDLETG